MPSIRDPSSFTSQLSSFRGRGAGGNGFGVSIGIRGGCEGGGLSEILPYMQIDQSPLYASQGFGGGALAVASAASEAEVRCVPGGVVVVGEVDSGGVRRHCQIGLVRRSGGDVVI